MGRWPLPADASRTLFVENNGTPRYFIRNWGSLFSRPILKKLLNIFKHHLTSLFDIVKPCKTTMVWWHPPSWLSRGMYSLLCHGRWHDEAPFTAAWYQDKLCRAVEMLALDAEDSPKYPISGRRIPLSSNMAWTPPRKMISMELSSEHHRTYRGNYMKRMG